MIILHILSQFQVTGAEVYAVTLANRQVADGHQVFIVSDTLHTQTTAKYIPYPIGNRKYWQRLKNVLFVRKLIAETGAEVVHAHSRAASWIGNLAVKGLKTPMVSTIHGRQHIHASSRAADIYGSRIIAVCQNLKTHLATELNLRAEKITVIPNGFVFSESDAHSRHKTSETTLTIAGRTTGPKGEKTALLLEAIIPKLLAQFLNLHINVVGGELNSLPEAGQKAVSKLSEQYPNQFHFVGFTNSLPEILTKTDILIGSGRIAIEGIWAGCAVLALGESGYDGLVTENHLDTCISSNFGDIAATLPLPVFDPEKVYSDVVQLLQNRPTAEQLNQLKGLISRNYNLQRVYSRVMDVYRGAIFMIQKPAHIPVFMYHKIPDSMLESKHRIFVPKAKFEKHLKYLQRNGFTTLTFQDYEKYRSGRLPLKSFPKKPIFLTFDDAYLDNLTNALPLLQKYGFKGTIFALGDRRHTNNFWDVAEGETSAPLMNSSQMLQMQDAGMEFGAHTMNHKDLRTLSKEDAFYEILESKKQLESLLGKPVISFAYPYGYSNDELENLVREAGFKYAVIINGGGLHLEENPMAIFRAYIFPEDADAQIRKKAGSWYRRYIRWKRGR